MFSLNLSWWSKMTIFRNHYLLIVSGGFVGLSVCLWVFVLVFFSPSFSPSAFISSLSQSNWEELCFWYPLNKHTFSNLHFGTNMPQKNCVNSLFDHEHYFQKQLLNIPMHGYFSAFCFELKQAVFQITALLEAFLFL